jgi:protein-tyrosine phosphatase
MNSLFLFLKNVAVESSAIAYPKTIKLEKFDIIDFPTAPIGNYFNLLTDKIHAHLNGNKQNKVLVHCMAGISRSNYFFFFICFYLYLKVQQLFVLI